MIYIKNKIGHEYKNGAELRLWKNTNLCIYCGYDAPYNNYTVRWYKDDKYITFRKSEPIFQRKYYPRTKSRDFGLFLKSFKSEINGNYTCKLLTPDLSVVSEKMLRIVLANRLSMSHLWGNIKYE